MHRAVVWDADEPPPSGGQLCLLWRSFDDNPSAAVISLPRVIERSAVDLRRRYLAWIHDLGHTTVGNKSLITWLELAPGLSYWWMTSIAHKPNYYESPHITDVIKCFAFEETMAQWPDTNALTVTSANPRLVEVFEQYAARRGWTFHATLRSAPVAPPPRGVRATSRMARLGGLLQWMGAAAFRWTSPARGAAAPSAICFFGPLTYLAAGASASRRFASHYWTRLVAVLEGEAQPVTWAHSFYPHPEIPTLTRADEVLRAFTTTSGHRHLLIDRAMDAVGVLTAVRYYLRLVWVRARTRVVRSVFRPAGSDFDFWPMFRRDWETSLVGPAAWRHCLRLALTERALRALPRQTRGFFLQENQPWELALIHAWRRAGHGHLVGVPHTTVRFWDLRYFHDARVYNERDPLRVPRPDAVAVNGPHARAAYEAGGYPAAELVDAEALRFDHLLRHQPRVPHEPGHLRLLICGDNIPGSNDKIMRVVTDALATMPAAVTCLFKPHRASGFDPVAYGVPGLRVVQGNLEEWLAESDVAITGAVTSAAVDAYASGVAVATVLDAGSLNGSPLLGVQATDLAFVSTAEELTAFLSRLADAPAPPATRPAVFWLDPALPRWRALLSGAGEVS